MKIDIKSCIQGAKEAEGITVIIDVFRASNTIIACMAQGAEYIIPVGALEDAIALKKQFPDHLLFGERKGLVAE
jgi:2-phosphosulfolactate phosphatase